MYWKHDPSHPVTRVCKKCGLEKPLPEFYLCRKTGYRRHVCKPCFRARMRRYYAANRERRIATVRRWYEANPRRAIERINRWKRRNRHKVREYHRQYELRYPWKTFTRQATKMLCRLGLLERPGRCADCGGQATQHHHLNYHDPFAVVALCRACHLKRHGARVRTRQGDGGE